MARPRSEANKGLPLRWRYVHGAYYYQVPKGSEALWDDKSLFRLGTKLHEAYQVWANRLTRIENVTTINKLLDRYSAEVIPTKAAASRTSNIEQVKHIRAHFGERPLDPFPPRLVYQYVDQRSVKVTDPKTKRVTGGRIAAHREIELLSHAFTKAVEWGYIDRHPFKNEVRLTGEAPRDRYIEDWEIIEVLALEAFRSSGSVLMIQAYIRIKLLTGMAQGDLLRLTEVNLQADGIHNQRHKTKGTTAKKTIYTWSDELRDAVAAAKEARTNKSSEFLFCNKDGECYINEETGKAPGWKSMWQRFMARVLKETKVTEHFTEHDLRAKVASDAATLEHARSLLAHADSRTTDKIYRRKAERVEPLR